ncbi:hypothetical protein H704_00865 [Bartonella bacilliformis Peru38]|uniref:Uncharacterized protein n=2 Tax=Bartonella bacilliformis TaxID=774 RepID=A1UTD4_BARBK|nr:hypothetical protein [Bartonella bacilliformis]ABM45579.1 conserved hypothetical protein [Bartonella bacilliformis KC583]AMG86008.1 hypothetical protein AL467_04560 [Bartonella bacilliformis]EKS43497.1 hypothetical protein BbINS_04507 [Bartonella bacilliformis INS]EYS89675.1 hypothetical protein X472_00108 [Bartonella bacilliformis San Pedro600-02]EYS94669.1 hypothetical protein X470_00960 [Bartonella bacilliformis Peru-18]
MIKFCWHRIIFLILFFLLVFAVSFLAYQSVKKMIFSHQIVITKGILSEDLATFFSGVAMSFSKIDTQKKQSVVDQARRDAIFAVLASGQNNEQAQKFGKTVTAIALKAISRSSVIDTNL